MMKNTDRIWPARQVENKISVYLNERQYRGILDDARCFSILRGDGRPNVNRFCNLALCNHLEKYTELMKRRFEKALKILRSRFRNEKAGTIEMAAREIAFANLDFGSEPKEKSGRSVSLLIDPDKQAMVQEAISRSFMDIDISEFIRGLLRSYLSFPFFMRERIIYADRIRIITKAIENRESVAYKHPGSGEWHHFYPAVIGYSKHEYYNYVVGQIDNSHHTTYAVRLSNMAQVYDAAMPAVFTEDFPLYLERMQRNGIQFGINEDRIYEVTLTEDGYEEFNRRYLEQPDPVSTQIRDDGSVRLAFDCSRFQLDKYFMPFNGKILEYVKDDIQE